MRPLLFLDVDGVIALRQLWGPEFVEAHVVSDIGVDHVIGLNTEHGVWIRSLADLFEIIWCTGWQHDAPRLLGPLLDLPEFEVLEFAVTPRFGRRFDKKPDLVRRATNRALAWVDDDLDDTTREWAEARTVPTLLIEPDPTQGLQLEHITELRAFAERR